MRSQDTDSQILFQNFEIHRLIIWRQIYRFIMNKKSFIVNKKNCIVNKKKFYHEQKKVVSWTKKSFIMTKKVVSYTKKVFFCISKPPVKLCCRDLNEHSQQQRPMLWPLIWAIFWKKWWFPWKSMLRYFSLCLQSNFFLQKYFKKSQYHWSLHMYIWTRVFMYLQINHNVYS
jgi:hypothetical protein